MKHSCHHSDNSIWFIPRFLCITRKIRNRHCVSWWMRSIKMERQWSSISNGSGGCTTIQSIRDLWTLFELRICRKRWNGCLKILESKIIKSGRLSPFSGRSLRFKNKSRSIIWIHIFLFKITQSFIVCHSFPLWLNKEYFFRGIRKISVPENDGEFTSVPL